MRAGLHLFFFLVFAGLPVFSAVVVFQPLLDSDSGLNTSATTAYNANNTNHNNANAGIPDNTTTSYTDTYHFLDPATGIEFSFDVTWEAVGGNLNPNGNILGVGNQRVEAGESITVTINNLTVDTSGYIPNSIVGIPTDPTVINSDVSFRNIIFGNWGSGGDDSSATLTLDDEDPLTFTNSDDRNFLLGTDGYTLSNLSPGDPPGATSASMNIAFDDVNSIDPNWRLSATRFRIQLEIIPEPSAILLLLLGTLPLLQRKRHL